MTFGVTGRLYRGAVLALVIGALAACDSVEERTEKRYEAGLAHLEAGELGKAMLEFRNALKLDGTFAPAYYEVGRIFEGRGEFERAFAHYRKTLDLAPDHAGARLKIAEYYLLAQNLPEAQTEIDAVLAAEPENADALALSAAAAMADGAQAEARGLLDRALAAGPDRLQPRTVEIGYLLRAGETHAALTRTDEALTLHPKALGLHRLRLSILRGQGETEAVGAQLATMIETYPGQTEFREARVVWAMEAGRPEIAEDELRALAAAEPERLERVVDLVRLVRAERGDAAAREELVGRLETAPDRPRLELALAEYDMQTENAEAARERLAALAEGGSDIAGRAAAMLAQSHYAAGDAAAGDAVVDAALARDPKDVEAIRLKGARLIEGGDLEAAIKQLRTGLDEAPDNARLLALAGRAQELDGNLDLANDRLASAVRADDYAAATVERYVAFLARSGRTEGAEAVLAEAVSRAPGNAALLERLALARISLENWGEAEQTIAALEALDAPRARELRAAALIGQERFDEGAALLRSGEGTRRAAEMTALVATYLRAGEEAEAIRFLEEILSENPENLQALGLRGNLHARAGEEAEARARYSEILALDADNVGARLALARLAEGTGDLDAAEAEVRAALDLSPDNLFLLVRLAQYRDRQGDVDAAIETYQEVYDRAPDSLLVANNLASLLSEHRAGDPEALDEAYRIAGRLKGSPNLAYRDTYGWTRYLAGEYAEALSAIEPVAEALPDNPWARYHLGMVLAAMDRGAEARPHLEAALTLSEGTPFAPRDAIEARLGAL